MPAVLPAMFCLQNRLHVRGPSTKPQGARHFFFPGKANPRINRDSRALLLRPARNPDAGPGPRFDQVDFAWSMCPPGGWWGQTNHTLSRMFIMKGECNSSMPSPEVAWQWRLGRPRCVSCSNARVTSLPSVFDESLTMYERMGITGRS